ncbi:MAG: hypothetical protein MZV49_09010 [Rhodopseudomonas palustris]|nr:hypothetical protein [Rhodopseudomonas palustris]
MRLGADADGGEMTGAVPAATRACASARTCTVRLAMSHFHLFDPKSGRRDPRRRLVSTHRGGRMNDVEPVLADAPRWPWRSPAPRAGAADDAAHLHRRRSQRPDVMRKLVRRVPEAATRA